MKDMSRGEFRIVNITCSYKRFHIKLTKLFYFGSTKNALLPSAHLLVCLGDLSMGTARSSSILSECLAFPVLFLS